MVMLSDNRLFVTLIHRTAYNDMPCHNEHVILCISKLERISDIRQQICCVT